jgi:hypothetical protein
MRNIRIPANINGGKNITFKLDQDFDNLEIMSLTLSAYDVYAQMSSDFGVVVGRVSVNGGFGVQNAKVSVFIPLSTDDAQREEILQLYPFKGVADKLSNGVRYNIFPRVQQQNLSHQPIGIFPEISDFTYYPTYLELYEKYYKYTTTTNGAGDYMIFGVPVGAQYMHMDFDLFDTKSFYVTADDLVMEIKTSATISAQLSSELTQAINPDFELMTGGTQNGSYVVKPKTDIDSMPNIFSENKVVNVVPFWGDKTVHNIGITRCDFEINYEYVPTAVFFGSFINMNYWSSIIPSTETNAYLVDNGHNKYDIQNQNPALDLKAIAYKHLGEYQVERYGIYSAIPSSDNSTKGVFIIGLPMYEDYYITDEFGQLVSAGLNSDGTPSKRGVPTKGHYVFEFFDDSDHIYGNGRRSPYGQISKGTTIPQNYSTNLTPGIRVPANRNGHYYLNGWEVNNYELGHTLFEYDILKGSPRFYTVETKFRTHADNDVRLPGNYLQYIPLQNHTNYEFPISQVNPDNPILRGSLFAPRIFVENIDIGTSSPLRFANELIWLPWLPVSLTGNYFVKAWDWIYGIGVKHLSGTTYSEVFADLYGTEDNSGNKTMSEYAETITWFFGDNPRNPENIPTANFYAQLLAQKPESTGRNINSIHTRFNLAVHNEYTAGMFASSIESGASKVLFETGIVDITDDISNLIAQNVYSSWLLPNHKYIDTNGESRYYLFGTRPNVHNALYEIQKRYFNE